MEMEAIVTARKTAESAVSEMKDGPLKVAAFETILRKLLDATSQPAPSIDRRSQSSGERRATKGSSASGTTSRITSLVDEGFFSQQRSLAEIQGALGERGWHYDQNFLSTPVMRLVRRRVLRRTQVSEGTKKVWKYSIY
ncbi:MAG TPA: hypothetical protein VMT53_07635 [Terriglobales bacterium]|nr:hypothetical protein [Terriglobales bacterium]